MTWKIKKPNPCDAIYCGKKEWEAPTAWSRFSGWVNAEKRILTCTETAGFLGGPTVDRVYTGGYRRSSFEPNKWLVQKDGDVGYCPVDVEVEELINEVERLYAHDIIEGYFD